jgi:hypothetical protein
MDQNLFWNIAQGEKDDKHACSARFLQFAIYHLPMSALIDSRSNSDRNAFLLQQTCVPSLILDVHATCEGSSMSTETPS